MTNSRVSIIVRTKNRPVLLARALDDLLAQSFSDWEAVVVNDGGDPAPVDELVAAREAAMAGRCRVIHNAQSVGMEAASNRGVAETAGAYIAVHDDDDTWSPSFLERTVAELEDDPDLVGVAVRTQVIVEEFDGKAVTEIERWMFTPPGDVVTVFDLILSNRVVPIGLLVRREAVRELGGFDESLAVAGDWEFNLRLALSGPVSYIGGAPLAYWHQRPIKTDGALANSVHGLTDLHFRYDRLVRDRALRADLENGGIGTLLYLSKFIAEQNQESERRLADRLAVIDSRLATVERQSGELSRLREDLSGIVHQHVQYHSAVATARRAVRRVFRRSTRERSK